MKKKFKDTFVGKLLAKKGVQDVIHGVVGEIPIVGRALSGILTPKPDGVFNFKPNPQRTFITIGLGIAMTFAIAQGWVEKEQIQSVVDLIFDALKQVEAK
jgi:hypothetical protein